MIYYSLISYIDKIITICMKISLNYGNSFFLKKIIKYIYHGLLLYINYLY